MDNCISNKANEYAGRFNMWKKKTALAYIEMAKVVVTAKEDLSRDRFEEFTNLIGYRSTDSFISKLYRIGLQSELFEKNIDQLPSSFTTLYALTTVDNGQLRVLFDEQRITPALKGNQLESLLKIQKRYSSCNVGMRSSRGQVIDINEPMKKLEPIELRIDMNVTNPQLVQFLRQLELLTRINEINVSIPDSIRQRINQPMEKQM